ncbi:MAG: N-6 DNA methylase [Spirochaetia bacterium]
MNSEDQPHLYGQDWNDEAYAICRAGMLIKDDDADNIKPDCTFEKDGFKNRSSTICW